MPKINDLKFVALEKFSTRFHFERKPETQLIMTDHSSVESFTTAGDRGLLHGIYIYHLQNAQKSLFGAKTVVDIGCGSGQFLTMLASLLPETQFLGLDLSEPMLAEAEKKVRALNLKNIQFRLNDISQLIFLKSKSIDGILSMQALLPIHCASSC